MTAGRLERNLRIPTSQPGVTLAADGFFPAADRPVPVLLTLLPYRKDGPIGLAWTHGVMRWFAEHGYASLLVDMRGIGSSDGVQRAAFDPDEVDDALTAIEWAAGQEWCDGSVGMWGHSYGAVMTLRAASRAPEHLRAIIPIQGATRPGPEFAHPDGAAGFANLFQWSMGTLLCQLMPPTIDHLDQEEQNRWKRRLDDEPHFVDLFGHGPASPSWDDRAIDASRVSTPAMFVAGWRDLFLEATVAAFESARGPKHLLIGPWAHEMPHLAAAQPMDFLSVALRWWDRWLKGEPNGIDDEPPVTLFEQGAVPCWRRAGSWPVAGHELELEPESLLAAYRPDPTVGPLNGMWGTVAALPFALDQHDDDVRSATATTGPLEQDIHILGRPRVNLSFAGEARPERLCAGLTLVEPNGRSTLITAGTTVIDPHRDVHTIDLWPTAFAVPAGHRLRVVVSDSDFPRHRPVDRPAAFTVGHIGLVVPAAADGWGQPAELDPPPPMDPDLAGLLLAMEPTLDIRRDLLRQGVDVRWGSDMTVRDPAATHTLRMAQLAAAAVNTIDPASPSLSVDAAAEVAYEASDPVKVSLTGRLSMTGLRVDARVDVRGRTEFERTWELALGW